MLRRSNRIAKKNGAETNTRIHKKCTRNAHTNDGALRSHAISCIEEERAETNIRIDKKGTRNGQAIDGALRSHVISVIEEEQAETDELFDGSQNETSESNDNNENKPLNCTDELSYKIIPSLRKNGKMVLLVDEKQVFRKNTSTSKHIVFVCRVSNCGVRINISNETNICTMAEGLKQHTHGPQTDYYTGIFCTQ